MTMSTAVFSRPAEQVLEQHDVTRNQGLSESQVEQSRQEHGRNQLREAQQRSPLAILVEQFKSVVILLLVFAAVVAAVSQRWPEAIAVVVVIAVNALIGFFTEWRASQSMQALRERSQHDCRVVRSGEEREIPAVDVVPGDILSLKPGDIVAADGRLLSEEGLKVDESALTGESVPVLKQTKKVEKDTPLAERACMVYKGTTVTDGSGLALVVAVGSHTELGKIADLAEQAESSQTPLQKRLDELGGKLAWITIAIAVVVALSGLWAGQELSLMVETAIALGIAAIPEGLPIVATMALARGMYLMAQRNAVVNRLPAVETLGATQVIFSDKTGTLTENEMRLERLVTSARTRNLSEDQNLDSLSSRLLSRATLCCNACLNEESDDDPTGDPEELALLTALNQQDTSVSELHTSYPRLDEEPFRHESMKMATLHRHSEGNVVAVKGAPEAVLDACSEVATEDGSKALDESLKEEWKERLTQAAGEGMRVLAVAEKRVSEENFSEVDPYSGLTLLGYVAFVDPPREGTRETIDACQAAGITVEMITGDQPETARAIAEAVGIAGGEGEPEPIVMQGGELEDVESLDEKTKDRIVEANIFARVEPHQKLGIVKMYQERGHVVAMTGDGINDAPALKKADIGVAMGIRGTEAAKQVADMVLNDDRLETMVEAVKQGRAIFDNIRKSIIFMLCTNVAEVLAVAIASILGWTLPLRPLQILYLNLLTDVFPALALAVGPAREGIMDEPSRKPDEAVLTRCHWAEIARGSVILAACVLGSLKYAEASLGLNQAQAITVSFLTLAIGKLWFTFNLRHRSSGVFRNEVTRNPWVWAAIAFCLGLLYAAIKLPLLTNLLKTEMPGPTAWALIAGASLIPIILGQLVLLFQGGRKKEN